MSSVNSPHFNIHVGDELTFNVQPLLHEIRHALQTYIDTGEKSIIDLRSIPLAPGEEEKIINTLGRGEVIAKLDVLGPSECYETRYAGVWVVTHHNDDNNIIGRFIEVTDVPNILKSQDEDIVDALNALVTELGTDTS